MVSKYRILYGPLRLAELVFAAIVTGLILTSTPPINPADPKFIYAIAVAGLSIVLGLIWSWPAKSIHIIFLVDFILFINWIITFGLMAEYTAPMKCGSIWAWGDITKGGSCSQWTAVIAFSFLSCACWLLTFIVGIGIVYGKSPRPPLSQCWKPVKKWIDPTMQAEDLEIQ